MIRPPGLLCCLGLLLVAPLASAQMTIFKEPLSPRIANYRIDATLNAETKRITASEMILWHNKSDSPTQDLRFHLYLNGFRNEKMSFLKESGGKHRGNKMDEEGFGFTQVRSLKVLPHAGDATSLNFSDKAIHPDATAMNDKFTQMEFLSPDDGNSDDLTYFRVPLEEPLQPGASVWIYIEWEAQLPQPPFARTGAKEEFFFVGQWFPKIAVLKSGGNWTDHQFHLNTEFFADYGAYDVNMTVPSSHILGATGLEVSVTENGDTKTHSYHAEDVHDFAWTCSPEYVVGTAQAQDVAIRVLCQKEHEDQMQRMLDAAVFSVEYFQNWYGDYPFPNLTVVDPRRGASGAGGMEYPTLITAGTSYGLPEGVRSLEMVTLHEFGHNYWYHLLASNEWEESWLDEGINSYTEVKIMEDKYGFANTLDLLGIKVGIGQVHRMSYMSASSYDPTVRNGWDYYSNGSYGTNSYSKPAVILLTFTNHIGDETMLQVMQTYVKKWSFKHPVSQDFIDVVNEVTGEDYNWFFQQALYTRNTIDYSVGYISSVEEEPLRGFDITMTTEETPKKEDDEPKSEGLGTYHNIVKIRREGEFIFPVEIEFTYKDGEKRRETWDGKDLWKKFEFTGDKQMVSATVDPDYKVILDVNFTNNSKTVEPQMKPVVAATSSMLVRLQTLMDLLSF